jgi:hypothetical protein
MSLLTRNAPRQWALVAAQLLAGALLSVAVGYVGMLIGRTFFAGDPAGFGDIVASLGGIILGAPLGAALGVSLAGRLIRGRQALWATLIGAYLGSWSMFALVQIFRNSEFLIAWGMFFVLGVVGALIADRLALRR